MYTLKDDNQKSLHQYHFWRKQKKNELSDWQQQRVCDCIKNFWLYRSDVSIEAFEVYGVSDVTVVFDDQQSIDEYVIDMEVDDDFEYAVEVIQITGRQLGDLIADWD